MQMASTRREVVKKYIGMIAVGVSSIVLTRELDCFEKVLAQNEKGKSDINLKSGKATYWQEAVSKRARSPIQAAYEAAEDLFKQKKDTALNAVVKDILLPHFLGSEKTERYPFWNIQSVGRIETSLSRAMEVSPNLTYCGHILKNLQ